MDIDMSEPFVQSLQITALGMGLVFAAIILLWWLMSLLTAITAEKDRPGPVKTASAIESEAKAQAAAVAVAIALAEQQTSGAHPFGEPRTAIVSAWQLGMRTNQLYEKRAPTIQKPHKAG